MAERSVISFWERESFTKYDFIIIGSGIVGLTTAIVLKEKYPGKETLILERGVLPSGASTKNAGFACIGSLSELESDLTNATIDEVLEIVEMRKTGLNILKKRIGQKNMDFIACDSYELLFDSEMRLLERIAFWNSNLKKIFRKEIFEAEFEKTASFGFGSRVAGMINNKAEGQLDTGKMMKRLIHLARSNGVDIKTGAEVTAFEENSSNVKVRVYDAMLAAYIDFKSEVLFVCSNAFSDKLIPGIGLQPGRGQVLITLPIHGLKVKGIFHFDKGFYYFRNVGNRILFGGGRNKYFESERSIQLEINKAIIQDLKAHLTTTILPGTSYKVDMQWSGIMAFGQNKKPIIRQHSDRVYLGVRLGGMGVAIGSIVARDLVKLYSG